MEGLKTALEGQFRAGLTELRDAVVACPVETWLGGDHPRTTWRIAYHAIYYTDLYLHQGVDDFTAWVNHKSKDVTALWGDPPVEEPYSKDEVVAYLDDVLARLSSLVGSVDLAAEGNGFPWYKNGMNKLEHYLMNIRHMQEHVGQVRERIYSLGLDTDWIGKR